MKLIPKYRIGHKIYKAELGTNSAIWNLPFMRELLDKFAKEYSWYRPSNLFNSYSSNKEKLTNTKPLNTQVDMDNQLGNLFSSSWGLSLPRQDISAEIDEINSTQNDNTDELLGAILQSNQYDIDRDWRTNNRWGLQAQTYASRMGLDLSSEEKVKDLQRLLGFTGRAVDGKLGKNTLFRWAKANRDSNDYAKSYYESHKPIPVKVPIPTNISNIINQELATANRLKNIGKTIADLTSNNRQNSTETSLEDNNSSNFVDFDDLQKGYNSYKGTWPGGYSATNGTYTRVLFGDDKYKTSDDKEYDVLIAKGDDNKRYAYLLGNMTSMDALPSNVTYISHPMDDGIFYRVNGKWEKVEPNSKYTYIKTNNGYAKVLK